MGVRMSRKRTSPIWALDKEKIQKLLNESSSFVEVLTKLGLNAYSGNHRTLNQRIKEEGLDIEELKKRRKEKTQELMGFIKNKNTIPLSEIMVENSTYGTNHLKRRLVKEKVLEYFCEKCKNKGSWMGEKLILQLEHKNGKSRDHRLENLCFLCPNCHSQTETYAGRNSSLKKSRVCIECDKQTKGKGERCGKCAAKKFSSMQPQKFFVSKEELQELVKQHSMTALAKKFGVTDNSVRKRCKRLGVDWPKPRSNK